MRRKLLILDDLEGHWQPVRSAILATAGLLVWKRRHTKHGPNTLWIKSS